MYLLNLKSAVSASCHEVVKYQVLTNFQSQESKVKSQKSKVQSPNIDP